MDRRPDDVARIRTAQPSDRDAIASIAAATDLFPVAMLDSMIAGYLEGTSRDIWLVADVGNETHGFAFCEPERMTEGTWNLLAIGVRPERQRCGIGAALTKSLEQILREARARVLIVETIGTPAYARAQAFYEREGYVVEARIREFWDVGCDKLVFWKHL